MIKSFPDEWHQAGSFDYEESKYMKFLKEDPRCPSGRLFEYKDDESGEYTLLKESMYPCDTPESAWSDASRGDVFFVDTHHDWCWNAWGWEINPGVAMMDSFRLHIWVKWTSPDDTQPDGGVWARRRWDDEAWYACPRAEWCELDVSIENMDWNKYGNQASYETEWTSDAYFEAYDMAWTNSEVYYDPSSLFGCAYTAAGSLDGFVGNATIS
jgi:hypothetical protein